MLSFKKNIGDFGEDKAVQYLVKCGYKILKRNFRARCGEIDIIGLDGDYITFIEVKTRYSRQYGSPSESITYFKQAKIYKTAQMYIMINRLHKNNFRFDVVEISLNQQNNDVSVNLIKNAF